MLVHQYKDTIVTCDPYGLGVANRWGARSRGRKMPQGRAQLLDRGDLKNQHWEIGYNPLTSTCMSMSSGTDCPIPRTCKVAPALRTSGTTLHFSLSLTHTHTHTHAHARAHTHTHKPHTRTNTPTPCTHVRPVTTIVQGVTTDITETKSISSPPQEHLLHGHQAAVPEPHYPTYRLLFGIQLEAGDQ